MREKVQLKSIRSRDYLEQTVRLTKKNKNLVCVISTYRIILSYASRKKTYDVTNINFI